LLDHVSPATELSSLWLTSAFSVGILAGTTCVKSRSRDHPPVWAVTVEARASGASSRCPPTPSSDISRCIWTRPSPGEEQHRRSSCGLRSSHRAGAVPSERCQLPSSRIGPPASRWQTSRGYRVDAHAPLAHRTPSSRVMLDRSFGVLGGHVSAFRIPRRGCDLHRTSSCTLTIEPATALHHSRPPFLADGE